MKNAQNKKEKKPQIQKGEDDSLLSQLYASDPKIYDVYRICSRVAKGDVEDAVRIFFTTESFQGRADGLGVTADIFNRLISMLKKSEVSPENVSSFALKIKDGAVEFKSDKSVSGSLQLMAGQALTIVSWMVRGLTEGADTTITADADEMAKAMDKDRGPSFMKVPNGMGIDEVGKEGEAGFYWRGVEKMKKLGSNVLSYLKYAVSQAVDELVMYLMDHGAVPVPAALLDATKAGKVSTLHETFFVNDILPGSVQTTSTGAGHFQGEKIDIKYVTEGSGIQVNVKYDPRGEIMEVIAHPVKKGDWTVALPGYVDYTINLGGLRFNDISVSLSADEVRPFNSFVVPPEGAAITDEEFAAELQKFGAMLEIENAPYVGMMTADGPALVETQGVPICRWIDNFTLFNDDHQEGLAYLYETASSIEDIKNAVKELAKNNKWLLDRARVYRNTSVGKEKAIDIFADTDIEEASRITEKTSRPVSLGGTEAVDRYLADSADVLNGILSGSNAGDKLLRVPVELIASIGLENIKDLLVALQATPHGFVELYSSERPEGVTDTFGIVTKELPESLRKDARTRANTVTLFPVFKGEELSVSRNKRWGGEDYRKSVISPLGFNYDRAGVVRSIVLGLRLSAIAGDTSLDENSDFVKTTYEQYKALCLAQGQSENGFDLTARDIVNMAKGQGEEIIHSLNKLIKLLPIMPVNTEELKVLYERMREVLIRA